MSAIWGLKNLRRYPLARERLQLGGVGFDDIDDMTARLASFRARRTTWSLSERHSQL